jgi:hypothetical protein
MVRLLLCLFKEIQRDTAYRLLGPHHLSAAPCLRAAADARRTGKAAECRGDDRAMQLARAAGLPAVRKRAKLRVRSASLEADPL